MTVSGGSVAEMALHFYERYKFLYFFFDKRTLQNFEILIFLSDLCGMTCSDSFFNHIS